MKIALIGNPNSGKTTLFNTMTGLRHHVGNWPGKTIEKKEGVWKDTGHDVIDLPGSYDIYSRSGEESVVREFVRQGDYDILINIVDCASLERNLYLTMQLLEEGKRPILALNFTRYSCRKGQKLDKEELSKLLGIPVVQIEAIGDIDNLKHAVGSYKKKPVKKFSYKSAKERYMKISEILNKVTERKITKRYTSDKIDRIAFNRWLGIPFYLLLLFIVFQLTYTVSQPVMDIVDAFFAMLSSLSKSILGDTLLNSFITDGIISGVGSIVIFLPTIMLMYLMLALLEDSGYMSRAAYLMDRFMARVGLHGMSFIPLVLGFGCNVPAIMSTRSLKDKGERLKTILMIPYMSCSARLVVFIMFASIFFPKYRALVVWSLYILGVLIALATGYVLSKIFKTPSRSYFFIELPPYRLPRIKNVLYLMWDKSKEFLKVASSIILSVVLVIWFLSNAPFGVEYASEESVIGMIGNAISPVFEPLGFGDWRSSVSLVFGFLAKEVVIGTFGTTYGVEGAALQEQIAQSYTPLSAYSFLIFILIYMPCMATLAVIRRESSTKIAVLSALYSVALAWLMSFLVYQGGMLL